MNCPYCGEVFEKTAAHKWGRYCSHACRYAVELPLTHSGQTFVTLDDHLIEHGNFEPPAAPADNPPDPVPTGMRDFLTEWLRLTPGQRDAVTLVILHPEEQLTKLIQRSVNPQRTIQAFHNQLLAAARIAPTLKKLISRYRPRRAKVPATT